MAEANSLSTADFVSFGLHPDILRTLSEQGYSKPTPIQAKAIPVALSGRDMIGAAQTGTGKTASFLLPIIQRLLSDANNSASPARHPVRALVLTPTRELADQVAMNVRAYAKHTLIRNAAVFGGVGMNTQIDVLRRGVEILIATPGRLLDHVQQKTVNLSQVKMLVLDEADRMLDMGFLPDLHRILNLLPKQRQTLLFSATFSNEIKKLASGYLLDPLTIEVTCGNSTADTVEQVVYEIDERAKCSAVVNILNKFDFKQVIIFVNSKIGANRLTRQLGRDGVIASAIHGDRSQLERIQVLEAFKKGEIQVLVATDVAARGIDISDLPGVINYDLPYSPEDYIHRIGRTGRAGAAGMAISLCSSNERKYLAEIEKLIKRALKRAEPLLEPVCFLRDKDVDGMDARPMATIAKVDMKTRRLSLSETRHLVRPEDEFFYKPYQPSLISDKVGKATSDPVAFACGFGTSLKKKGQKRQVSALLAGFPRKVDP
ncbi:DEAD/DEAH box helicase [Candidatus Pandoraea novymonadis]|uniref:ATP-dependent RNA helicase RhlE n=1 Tax=Candidatus Pandoraea novymonadis TaxID=1808959 RepID=A0ABX5FEM8_9BURK|nr:DEAD/DEAH box helicase [Candidatus Pandoraea novymonadis]PSB91677.1 ATP-dependent RNA helicase RhlE [Candidatus Pandoraea novymonadis]